MKTRPEDVADVADDALVTLHLVAGLPVPELHERLQSASRATDVGHRMLAFYLHDMQERGAFQVSGHASAVHYATAQLGIPRRSARDLVAVGQLLDELRKVDAAFARGAICWSKVRSLLKVVSAPTQEAWIERAQELSCDQLEVEVKCSERGKSPARERGFGLRQVRFAVSASLDALGHAKWEQAKLVLGAELGRSVTDQDLLSWAADIVLERAAALPQGDGDAEGPRAPRRLPQIVVQRCPDCERAAVQTEDGPLPLDPAAAEALGCEAELVDLAHDGSLIDRPTPEPLRKAVLARDGNRCRCCKAPFGLQVHHIVWRSRHGRTTLTNLITACASCHGRVHAGLLSIQRDAYGAVQFVDREGRPLDRNEHGAGIVLAHLRAAGGTAPGTRSAHGP